MKTKILYILFLTLSLISCEKKIDWTQKPSGNKYIVVESTITNEYKNQLVKISKSVSEINQKPEMISGANVVISDGFDNYTFQEDSSQKGYYYSKQKFIAVINKTYQLSITFEGKTFTAFARMFPVSDFSIVKYAHKDSSKMYYLTEEPNQFSLNENAMYEISIDWSALSEYSDSSYTKTHALLYFYSLSSIDIPEIFSAETDKIFFPKGSIITERKYSLTPAHAQFIRSLLLETTWRGGTFDLEQGNVTTNLTNGALGFFAACSVIEKQTIVK